MLLTLTLGLLLGTTQAAEFVYPNLTCNTLKSSDNERFNTTVEVRAIELPQGGFQVSVDGLPGRARSIFNYNDVLGLGPKDSDGLFIHIKKPNNTIDHVCQERGFNSVFIYLPEKTGFCGICKPIAPAK